MEELTLAIIKPDAIHRNLVGKIIARYEESSLRVAAMKLKQLTRHEVESFYEEHRARPFFNEIVGAMSAKPVVLLVLEGKDAVLRHRKIIGATDPAKAAEGTIRKLYAKSIGENSVHGSDSLQAAHREISYFFSNSEIYK